MPINDHFDQVLPPFQNLPVFPDLVLRDLVVLAEFFLDGVVVFSR